MPAVRPMSTTFSRIASGRWFAARTRSPQGAPAASVGHRPLGFENAASDKLEPESEYGRGGVEPHLEEVLRDPIVQSLMRADRIAPEEVRRTLDASSSAVEPPPRGSAER